MTNIINWLFCCSSYTIQDNFFTTYVTIWTCTANLTRPIVCIFGCIFWYSMCVHLQWFYRTLKIVPQNNSWISPGLLCSKFYLLCFWAVLKKVTYYAQYYARNYCNYATVHTHFIIFNDHISIVRLQAIVFHIMLCCSVFIFEILCSWENLSLILYHVGMITIPQKFL